MRLIDLNSIQKFQEFLISKKNLICLTGAGISTASGIPDYRGENGSYKRGHKPMIHSEFVKSDISRKRYWTRSMAGYKYLAKAKPNKAHNSLVTLEKMGILKHIITQNVDSLHQKAGSMSVLDLHGRIEEIQCLSCQNVSSRTSFQTLLEEKNPSFIKLIEAKETNDEIRADGDMNVDHIDLTNVSLIPLFAVTLLIVPYTTLFIM